MDLLKSNSKRKSCHDLRRVISNQVRAANLLECLRGKHNAHSPAIHLRSITVEFLQCERFAFRNLSDLLDACDFLDFWAFGSALLESGKDFERDVIFVLLSGEEGQFDAVKMFKAGEYGSLQKPPWRFRQRENSEKEENPKDGLEGHWKAPLERSVLRDEEEPVIKPVRNHD
jgi:hypothetical protein